MLKRLLIAAAIVSTPLQFCTAKEPWESEPPQKSVKLPGPRDFVVDLKKVRRQYIANVRRGKIRLPQPDHVSPERRLQDAEADAVREWIRNAPVGAIGRIPPFYIRVQQVVDEQNFLIAAGAKPIWVKGLPTESLADDQRVRMDAGLVTVGTEKFQTLTGSKTVRSIGKYPEP